MMQENLILGHVVLLGISFCLGGLAIDSKSHEAIGGFLLISAVSFALFEAIFMGLKFLFIS
jgi:hypothetical protein